MGRWGEGAGCMQPAWEMDMFARSLCALGLACLALNGWASTVRAPMEMTLVWSLHLAADGGIEKMQAHGASPGNVQQRLESEIRTWRFRPGRLNGAAAPSRTALHVGVLLEPQDGDAWSIRVLNAGTGARLRSNVVPAYPGEASRARREGLVLLRIAYDATGKVSESTLVNDSPLRTGVLVDAARGAVKFYQIEPERIAGSALASTAIAPVCFKLNQKRGAPADRCAWTRPGDNAKLDETSFVSLEPAVTLESMVVGKTL